MPFWLAVILLEYAEWLAGTGRESEARPLVTESREIFERLRAQPWLQRLSSLGAGPRPALVDVAASSDHAEGS